MIDTAQWDPGIGSMELTAQPNLAYSKKHQPRTSHEPTQAEAINIIDLKSRPSTESKEVN
jgi:hypothetical protein